MSELIGITVDVDSEKEMAELLHEIEGINGVNQAEVKR